MAPHREGRMVLHGGSDLIRNRPVFSTDSKYIFVSSGFIVKIFSTASGECVQELKGHDGEVTGVAVNPRNKLQVFTSSLDGTINQWDYTDSVLLKTLNVGPPVHSLFVHSDVKELLFATIADKQSGKKHRLKLVQLVIPKAGARYEDVKDSFLISNVKGGDKGVALGPRGEFIASIIGSTLKILFRKDMELKKISADATPLTCVACHPVDYCIAVGDEKGCISIWRNFHQKEVRAREHWHSLRVEHLCYSPEGSTLYSVGHECTVVEWQHDTMRRKFLPRQGAPIGYITCAPNSQHRALSLMTNAILIQAHLKTTQTIQGLVRTNFNQKREGYLPTGLVLDPHTKALVTNGMVGQLQFFHLQEDRLLFSLDVTGENYISPSDLHQPLVHTEVEKVAFDLKGDWMATVERRDDQQTTSEMRLKFWQFDHQKQSFVLNTVIAKPHSSAIRCLSFRPPSSHDEYEPMVVTAGDDGKFKLWTLADDNDSLRKSRSWGCDSVGFFRGELPRCTSFSSDGSLLAVAFNNIVTMWDPDVNVLKKTLCHGIKSDQIEHLVFGHGAAAHCLISASSNVLNVWNLLTCTVMWRVTMDVLVLVADTESEYVAVFDKKANLFVFHPLEPKLVYTYEGLPTAKIMSAIFIPRKQTVSASSDLLPWENQSHLYFVTECLNLATITSDAETWELARSRKTDLNERLPPTPFAMLLNSQTSKTEKADQRHGMQDLPASASIRELLNSPAHVLPPVKSLCSTFLHRLIDPSLNRRERRVSEGSDDSDDENSLDSDDSDMEISLPNGQSGPSEDNMTQSEDTSTLDDQEGQGQPVAFGDGELRKLLKASRSGLKWLTNVFQETY
ncbi:WD repeat-containing protein 75-like [Asterias amurensis]|uniref:WD repeat-containing protein 75-like n=1 Tax=Asterias amurensis TaxID=7602 RepID=UPI003AB1956F